MLVFISFLVEDVQFNFSLLEEVKFMVNPVSVLSRPLDFQSIPEDIFAEQLTYMDAVSLKFFLHEVRVHAAIYGRSNENFLKQKFLSHRFFSSITLLLSQSFWARYQCAFVLGDKYSDIRVLLSGNM